MLERIRRASRLALSGLAVCLIGSTGAQASAAQPQPGCQLGKPAGSVQHVIYLQFDNVHFDRDNPNVPSDLEQMPHLLNFLTSNGALLTQEHTPLIAHTGGDIVTVETGLYPDRHGLAVTNSYRYFTPAGPARTTCPTRRSIWANVSMLISPAVSACASARGALLDSMR